MESMESHRCGWWINSFQLWFSLFYILLGSKNTKPFTKPPSATITEACMTGDIPRIRRNSNSHLCPNRRNQRAPGPSSLWQTHSGSPSRCWTRIQDSSNSAVSADRGCTFKPLFCRHENVPLQYLQHLPILNFWLVVWGRNKKTSNWQILAMAAHSYGGFLQFDHVHIETHGIP